MTLIRWTNRHPLADMFSNFFDADLNDFFTRKYSDPAANIIEQPDNFELELAAPGMKKDDFKISLENSVLTISSELRNETQEEGKNYTRKEFSYGSFSRSFTLPKTINMDKIQAEYQDGILKVILPKKEEAKLEIRKEIKIG
ncbi:MAG: Hsp20/alpha crystallin family protein [Bacteroidetes bacterium]|nr:Hsp20/alpha crystallin family protein [Bacteroidota bacterium]